MKPGCILLAFALSVVPLAAAAAQSAITRDISFTSHDGHAMTGRPTVPSTPGAHPALVFVQNAEASTLGQRTRNAAGEPVAFFDLYRDTLVPLGVGVFSYEGPGISPAEFESDARGFRRKNMAAATFDQIDPTRTAT